MGSREADDLLVRRVEEVLHPPHRAQAFHDADEAGEVRPPVGTRLLAGRPRELERRVLPAPDEDQVEEEAERLGIV